MGDSSQNKPGNTSESGKRNHIREQLSNQQPLFGAATMTASPAIIEVYGSLGLDFVWVDLEHAGPSGFHAPAIEQLTRTAEAAGIELLLRIPSGDPALIRKVLDCGARTILVPRVETVAEVREAIKATRFRYDGAAGKRGVGVGRANDWGNFDEDYTNQEDNSICLGVMIETTEAVDVIDDIANIPDLGFAFLGLSDLSVSLGVPFEKSHPDVEAAAATVRNACRSADVPVGCIATEPAAIEDAVKEGHGLVRIGDDISGVRNEISETINTLDGMNAE